MFKDSQGRTWKIAEDGAGNISLSYVVGDSPDETIIYDGADSNPSSVIDQSWLTKHGFKHDPNSDDSKIFGFSRKVGDVEILVGTWPWNQFCLSIMHNGYTIVTKRLYRDAIISAIKLFERCEVDEP